MTFSPRMSNTSRAEQACRPARTFFNSVTASGSPSILAWDPQVIPQYGADADELAAAGEAAATGAIPAAMANTATNNPVLRNISTNPLECRTGISVRHE